jgi:ABC-type dipeptide/oligopeptide/nickel transport system permease component
VLRYAIGRLLWAIPTLFVVVTLTFFLMRAIGGSPLRHGPFLGLSNVAWVKYGDPQPSEIERNLERKYGLDRPWYVQYAEYLKGVATLDFGPSMTFRNRTVNELIREQAPVTLQLGLLACAWALAIGVPVGVACALRPGSAFDVVARTVTGVGVAVPAFLIGTMLIYLVSVRGGLLPTSGWGDSWRQTVLPSLTLALLPAAWIARLLRASMLETLSADYVRAATAKGLARRRIVLVHALRNAAVPVLSAAGPLLGLLITGSFIVEEVFAIPGMGRFYIAAAGARDYPVVLGLTVLLTGAIVIANLLVDLLHAALDPRVREAYAP